MQLREFAEQVLFSSSLESKLRTPSDISDDHPGPGILTPPLPGRPPNLRFLKGRSTFEFPSVSRLEKEEIRGQLLHFFANHELLATELMALALLRFPNAPKAFRKGLLQTLKDEQEHTRIYMERMKQLGVEFGQFPVTGFFWRSVSNMATPLDYVTHLSLTFEQANLDYSKWYSTQFGILGDSQTEQILDRIYRDEIGHVGYGLKWFRRWKDPSLSDWEAFERHLVFPLSPSRAKGAPFNPEARKRAGLNSRFIDELFVYSKSKGKLPTIYLFNPFAEYAIAQGNSFTPNKIQKALARDLANLPQFLCRQDDVVLTENKPDTSFLSTLKRASIDLPEFQELDAGILLPNNELLSRKIDTLRPWAWSPEAIKILRPLIPKLSQKTMPTGADWETLIKPLFSKAWSADRLREYLAQSKENEWLCPDDHVGIQVNSYHDAMTAIGKIRKKGHTRVAAKALFGMAGGNFRRLWESEISSAQERWIRKTLNCDGALIIEPWLDRVLDFSFQYEISASGMRFLGFVRTRNDHRGQYQGSVFAPNFTYRFDPDLATFVSGSGSNRLKRLSEDIATFLEPKLARSRFVGPLGIDAFVYLDENRNLRMKPIVEINPRFTMGRLLLELKRQICSGRLAALHLLSKRSLGSKELRPFDSIARQLESKFPVELKGHPKPRITSGALSLNDPSSAQSCLAVFQVGKTIEDISLPM